MKGSWSGCGFDKIHKDPAWVRMKDIENYWIKPETKPLNLDFGDQQKTLVESYDQWFENNAFKHVLKSK